MKALRYFAILGLLTAVLPAAAQQDAALADYVARSEAAAPAPLLARESFRQTTAIRSVKLAPDGKHLVYRTVHEPDNRLYLFDTATFTSSLLLASPALVDAEWTADSSTLLLNLGNSVGRLAISNPAAPAYIAALKRKSGDYYLGSDRTAAGGALVVRKQEDGVYVLQRIDLAGNATEIFRTADRIDNGFLSSDGNLAFIDLIAAKQRRVVSVANAVETTLLQCSVIMQCHAVTYDVASNQLWLLNNNDSDLPQLEQLSLAEQRRQKVHSDPTDIAAPSVFVTVNNKPAVVQYHDGLAHNYAVDAALNSPLAAITRHFPGSNITPAIGNDGVTWLLTEESAVLAEARYYLFDSINGSFTEILADERNTALPASQALSASQPVHYRASDGMQLHGYVTVPTGKRLQATPLIALPHGGPWGRVNSNYSALTQFLVNRGYSVFEPNFRASTGYGVNYMLAGHGQFGNGAVQQDLTDGVNYLLAQGIGDREHLAIVGHSFGGFSVLSALAFTPELFKVGIASAPPAELGLSLKLLISQPASLQSDPSMQEVMRLLAVDVNDAADMQRLHDESPQAQLGAITAPLLLMAGADDDRVSIAHVKEYSLRLFNQRKTLSLLIDEDEGHGLSSPIARRAYFYLTESMLAHYLGGASEPLEDPLLAAYIKRKLLLNSNSALLVE